VLHAFENGEKTILASPALDIWAIGVIAYELLTDRPVFDRYTSREEVISQLVGRKPLPWEDHATKEESLRKLRMLKRSITKCLSREPKERPSAQELLDSWEKLFDTFGGDATVIPGETGSKSMTRDSGNVQEAGIKRGERGAAATLPETKGNDA
jgi:serine/threonine protein kinase